MKFAVIVGLVCLVLSACEKLPTGDLRKNNELVKKGEQIYKTHCLICHKAKGVGAKNWRKKDKQGILPPPPLNGTAHTWHHKRKYLIDFIKNGSPMGESIMPAWKSRLSNMQIIAVIAYIQSLWPEEIYQEWLKIEQR